MTIYFLGGGNMATAIIRAIRRTDLNEHIVVANRSEIKRQVLEQQFSIETCIHLPKLNAADVLVLAVKPQDMKVACENINVNGALVVSIAAALSISTLSQYLGGTQRIIRTMPNTPVAIGSGVIGLFADKSVLEADRVRVEKIMAATGMLLWLKEEEQLHMLTGISGSGSAYVFYLMSALQNAAQTLGFDVQTAHSLSLATFKGAVELAEQSNETLVQLQDKVTSKGGTTFAALEMLRQRNVEKAIIEASHAAVARSVQLSEDLAQ